MTRAIVEITVAAVLAAGIVATGVALVETKRESRALFGELEALRREEDRLLGEWSALQLEVGTLARHDRIDTLARDELGMVDPGPRVHYVEPAR